jgi:hypothetical protein
VQFCSAQDSSKIDRLISLPDKAFGTLDRKTASIEQKLDHQTAKYLTKLQRQEQKLRRRVSEKDSALAKQLFGGTEEFYKDLKTSGGKMTTQTSPYCGHLDSITTALLFLKQVDGTSNPSLQKSLDSYASLQGKLGVAEQVKSTLEQRQRMLEEQFGRLGMIRELTQFRKGVYYYQQQVKEYRHALEDPSKTEAKLMELAMKIPQFKAFFAKNSILGSLFSLPTNYNTALALNGLQTRAQIQQQVLQRFGTTPINGVAPQQYMQGQVQQAQSQLIRLKDKLNKMGVQGGDGTTELPSFKPNNQKTKTFLQRIEYGFNIQNQRATNFLPVTSDLAASVGYRLNDKSSLGVGSSYKLGLGKGFQNLHFSSQGIGLRSFVDYKMRRSLWLTGGLEYNYMQPFKDLTSLKGINAWQRSGLIGVSKKISTSANKQANLQLLYDVFALTQVPRSQPIKFRIGYTFHK